MIFNKFGLSVNVQHLVYTILMGLKFKIVRIGIIRVNVRALMQYHSRVAMTFNIFNRPIWPYTITRPLFGGLYTSYGFTGVWSIGPKYKRKEENRAENLSVGRGFVYSNGAIILIFYTYQERLMAEGPWRLAVKSFSGNFLPRRIPASAESDFKRAALQDIIIKTRYFLLFFFLFHGHLFSHSRRTIGMYSSVILFSHGHNHYKNNLRPVK